MSGLVERVRRWRPSWRDRGPDPFATLDLQLTLSRLSAEMDRLERAAVPFAGAHHARAASQAYDATLAQACRLIGQEVPEGRGPSERLLMEATLLNAGWSW